MNEGPGKEILQASFSAGDFRSFKSTHPKSSTEATVTEEASSVNIKDGGPAAGLYTCPEDGCTRIFQRHLALEKHLSLEKCTRSLEKHSLMDLAKIGYKSYLDEGAGTLPSLQAPLRHHEASLSPKEGWALRVMKKAYRFSEKQNSYLLAKFRIGQTTGHKLDAEVVCREMQRARGTDGAHLSQWSEFVTTSQVASFFFRQSAAAHHIDLDEVDIQAAQEESNFNQAKEAVAAIQLDHPLMYDQYNLCAMAVDGTLKLLKLPMLQHV